RYVAYFAPLGENGVRAAAVVAILGLSFLNYIGVKQGSLVQVVLTTAKLVAVAAMILLIFIAGGTAQRALPPSPAPSPIPVSAYGFAIAAGLFAFGGWHMVTYSGGETRDPKRNIPRALLIGVLAVKNGRASGRE